MTTSITAGVHVDRAELHHCVLDTGAGMITLGAQHGWPRVDVFFRSTAEIHALIAELVALKQEMGPPVITAPERPVHRLACGCTDHRCDCPGCRAGKPHAPGTTWNCDEHGKTAVAYAETAVADGEPWTRAGVAAAIVPAPSVPNPPYHMTPGTIGPCCLAEDGGYICNAQDGHDGPQHVAYGSDGGECHRWPVVPAPSGMQDPAPVACGARPYPAGSEGDDGTACTLPFGHDGEHDDNPVITDSERTCPESNPDSGAWCHRDGDHGVHRDPDGEEWRTDGTARGLASCGHPANDDGECDCSSWPERAVMAR